MPNPLLEDVFKVSGVPTHTFIKPLEYTKLLVSLRTAGRGLVIEGPSGIGKTTSVAKALEELGVGERAERFSGRNPKDLELIQALPDLPDIGVVIIDDFHRLPDDVKRRIADHVKNLADNEDPKSKLVLVGINRAGDALIQFAPDLNNRIDTIRFEANPEDRVRDLVARGEQALDVSINIAAEIAREAQGSFHLAQLLCHETCLAAEVTERPDNHVEINVSMETIRERVLEDQTRAFLELARRFATGPQLRRQGRGPYLRMLNWLADSEEWSIGLDQAMAQHPSDKQSVGQVVDKGNLERFMGQNPDFGAVLHYDAQTRVLSVEDPKFVYFLRNLAWTKFARRVGYTQLEFTAKYDFALSFSGEDRSVAEKLFALLEEQEVAVFYDENEQHRILAQNLEDYFGPIYRSEASFVIPLLGPSYPTRIWAKFESEQFKSRFGEGAVIPIWFTTAPTGMFDKSREIGGVSFDPTGDIDEQLIKATDLLVKKLADSRESFALTGAAATAAEADPIASKQ